MFWRRLLVDDDLDEVFGGSAVAVVTLIRARAVNRQAATVRVADRRTLTINVRG